MPKPERRDPAKEKYWRQVLRQWRRSGLTGRDFCAQQGLGEPSFYAWRREIARRNQEQVRATRKTPLGTRLPRGVRVPTELAVSLARRQSPGAAKPSFVKLAIAADTTQPSAIEVIVGPGRRLRVRPGFDVDLLRQLLRLLEEPSC